MQRREESQQHQSNKGSSKNSPIAFIDDNELYLVVVRGGNKGNVYGLGALSKRFTMSTCVDSITSQASMVHQTEEMHETIWKLNGELKAKDKTFEEKMTQLMQDNDQQKECICQQEEHIKFVLQHIRSNNLMRGIIDPPSNEDHVIDYSSDGSPHEHYLGLIM